MIMKSIVARCAAIVVPLFFVMAVVCTSYDCKGMPSQTFWISLKVTMVLGVTSIFLLWKLKKYSER